MNDLLQRFTSRKFLLALFGVLIVFGVKLTTDQIAAITTLIVAFTAVEGAADYIRAGKRK